MFWLNPDIFEDRSSLVMEVSILRGRADSRKLLASIVLYRFECSLVLRFDFLPESELLSDLCPFDVPN